MREMNIEVRATASAVTPNEFTLDLCYADTAFEHLNPYDTIVVTQVDDELLEDQPNWVYLNLDEAKRVFFEAESANAITALNGFFGATVYALALRIKTDQQTEIQIQEDIAVYRLTVDAAMGAKAPAIHTHTADDVSDLEVRIDDYLNSFSFSSRLGTAESSLTSLGGRMTTAEGAITGLGTRMSAAESAITGKVDKVTGKGLSTNDYTATAKGKVDSLAARTFIADASVTQQANLPTNYNLVSGVLGLANGLNAANDQQNILEAKHVALAGKVNALMAQNRSNGLMAAS